MCVPSANTRASRNVRSTASQPLIEKPASRWTGCAGVERLLPIAPMMMLRICSASSVQAIACRRGRVRGDERIARANGLDHREQPLQDSVVQRDRDEAEHGDRAQAQDQPISLERRRQIERRHDPFPVGNDEQQRQDRGAISQFRTMRIRSTTWAIGRAAEDELASTWSSPSLYRISICYLSIIVKSAIVIR